MSGKEWDDKNEISIITLALKEVRVNQHKFYLFSFVISAFFTDATEVL